MTDNRIITEIQYTHFSLKFTLDENYDSNDNNMFLNENIITNYISSGSYDTVIVSHNYHISVSEGNDVYDIRELQEAITTRVSNISISSSDEMKIDLFQILKASNDSLILFDRIISWIRNHEGTIT